MTTQIAVLSPQGWLQQRFAQLFSAREGTARKASARSAVEEAAAVRELAESYRVSDPSFASDLYAAADRHEREAEAATNR